MPSKTKCAEHHNHTEHNTPMVVGIDARVCLLEHRGWARYAREYISALSLINNIRLKVLVPSSLETDVWVDSIKSPHEVIPVSFSPASPDRFWDEDSYCPENWLGSVDLLHSLCRFVPPTTLRPVLATVHDIVPLITPPFKLKYREATIKVLNELNQPYYWIAAVSNQTKAELVHLGGIDDSRIRVIYEGVSKSFRGKYNLQVADNLLPFFLNDFIYFIYVGGAGENKNLHTLITAFEEVYHQTKVKLVLAGHTTWGYSDIFTEIDSSQGLHFVGYVTDEELCSLYCGARALIFPSFHEGFGLPIIEAMALGVPVLCSDIAIFKEVASESALYFDPYNSKSITQCILKLLDDNELRKRLIKLGLKRSQLFSWEKTAYLTMEYYKFIWNHYRLSQTSDIK